MTGSRFRTISLLPQTKRSSVIHSASTGIMLVATSSSASIVRKGTENMILMTDTTRGHLMDRVVCRSFGVSAIGVTAF